jgi:hypothetical protein
MADMLIMEFTDTEAQQLYENVNKYINLDPFTGGGDWPAGLLRHQAAVEGETFVVVETWESRAAQQEFMDSRLGPAFAETNVPPPARVTWLTQLAVWQRG